MSRITVFHLTDVARLPLIEREGLRTRADLGEAVGPLEGIDLTATGRFAHGKRVSAWANEEHARTTTAEHGAGLVSFTVDPGKAVAGRASVRAGDPDTYWESARPLSAWLADGDLPEDLEVHQPVPVRAKHVRLHAPLLTDEDLGDWAPLVNAVADEDRLSAKALMHLAVIVSDGEVDTEAFRAACALAWRDDADDPRLADELVETDPDKIASAALAEYGTVAPDVSAALRTALEETRDWADDNGVAHGAGLFARTGLILDEIAAASP
ncbi:MAG: hypothetical protein R3249_05450 [Nitriliruptorales bacterium]|nr:hypothetical protein [Nitriliruptorales bacterium]